MRGILIAVTATTLLTAAPAAAAEPDYAKAYGVALRCMVFSSFYKDQLHAQAAFDAWKKLGALRGLEDATLNADMDSAIARETIKLRQHRDYRAQTQADCRALGWAR